MRQQRVGGVLAALCVAAGSSGVLAIGLLATRTAGVRRPPPADATRSGWPIAGAFASPGEVGWIAADPNAEIVTGDGTGSAPQTPASTGETGGTTQAPAPPPPPTPAPAPAASQPPESFVANTWGHPVAGEATGYGCNAAIAYLTTYAAPGFWLVCPGYARGHQAMTACQSGASQCSVLRIIVIADPCPNAYMNEAANSWTLMGDSDAPLDPYGACA